MADAVVAIVKNEGQAVGVAEELCAAGFSGDDVSVLFPDRGGSKDFGHEQHSTEGAATGAGVGGVLGGAVGWLAGIGSLAIPGLGPFIAAGPIMAALSGAAAGAAVGGLTGALVGLGIPEYEARLYEGKIRDGNILFSVQVKNGDERKVTREIFERHGAMDISSTSTAPVPNR